MSLVIFYVLVTTMLSLPRMQQFEVWQTTIRSVDHVNKLVRSRKVAFSSFDDKRYLLCSIHSVPYGSFVIEMSLRDGCCYFCYQEMMASFRQDGPRLFANVP